MLHNILIARRGPQFKDVMYWNVFARGVVSDFAAPHFYTRFPRQSRILGQMTTNYQREPLLNFS